MKKFLSIILAVIMISSVLPMAFAAESETVILYTNDTHCAIEGYPAIAAYRAELIAQGKNVVLVDAGDAIQGEIIGSLTEGEAVVDLMNAAGYDYAVPGNHEFDYGMEVLLDLAQNKAEYTYISSNFYHLPTIDPVFAPYAIENFGDYQIAFVGISTPDTVTSSSPDYFKDENGNFIYGFPKYPGGMTNEALYENVQESVDSAIAEGADIVVAVGHTGILGSTDGWKSSDIIANTDGIDYFIDGHSHETIEGDVHKNKNNEDVILASTGEKFANFGVLTISEGDAETELISTDSVDVAGMSDKAKSAYNTVKAKVDGYNDDIAYLYEKIGTSEAELIIYDDDGNRIVRCQETNAGDFVADAYRAVTGADVAIVNGGGIRAEVEIGDVSRKTLMNVNSFNNDMCVLEVTGQQLIDVLEHGARECPELIGGFFQVSGITFEIHTYRETPVITDQLDNFIGLDGSKERRVENVLVGGEPIDLAATYTLAGSQYILTTGGDGLTMLAGSTVVQKDGLPCDSEMLIKYFTEDLNGIIPADMYGNPDGNGRIIIVEFPGEPFEPECDYEIEYGDTLTVTAESDGGVFVKFVPEQTSKYIFRTESDGVDTGACLYDSYGNEVPCDYNDDADVNDFLLECELEEGKEYYLNVYVHFEESGTFELILECGHSFENGTCTVCGKICDHTEIDFLGFCSCGEFFIGKDIEDGDESELENEDENEMFWFRFIPEVSGLYSFKSVSEDADPDCFLFNADGEYIGESYDENDMDFDLCYSFEAGETYYFGVHNCYSNGVFKVSLTRVSHTADDGSVHTDIEFIETTYSNCTEHGYSEGLYCNECEEFISGHKELPIDVENHVDEDWDGICDLCGKENLWEEEECGCICHSENLFLQFIWKIANFFHKIFGIMPYCECGEEHHDGGVFYSDSLIVLR